MYRIIRATPRSGDEVPHHAGPAPHLAAARGRIRHRDQSVYRALFSTDTAVARRRLTRHTPTTKVRRDGRDDFAPLMVGTWKQLDALARILYLESVLVRPIAAFGRDKEKTVVGDPGHLADRPLGAAQRRYRRLRIRRSPVSAGISAHKGIDLGCERGDAGLRHGRRRGRKVASSGRTPDTAPSCI